MKTKFKELKLIHKVYYIFFVLTFACVIGVATDRFSHYMNYTFITQKYYIIDSTWVEVPGECVIESHTPRGNETVFSYEFNGKKYNDNSAGNDLHPYFATFGDIFMLKVNPKSPENYVIIKWKPTFLPGETTNTIVGTIISKKGPSDNRFRIFNKYYKPIDSPYANYHIGFAYSVSGINYEKGQYLSPYLDTINERVEVGQKFVVEYRPDSPKRASLHVDRPIN